MLEKVFKAYDVRAVYPDPLDEKLAWRIGFAAGRYFGGRAESSGARTLRIVVGRDMRKSSPSLCDALQGGLRAAGAEVIDVGMIDTPQLYFAVDHCKTDAGIQTTASHNPAQYNGFKVCGRGGVPVGEDSGLGEIRAIAEKTEACSAAETGGRSVLDLGESYKAFVRRSLKVGRALKVVVDASNGMAGRWGPVIFGDAENLTCRFLNTETTGEFVHDPNPLVDANLDQLREEVRRTGADLGVCFDGDADRCMVVDERADIVRCDLLTALLAGYFLKDEPGGAAVYDLRSSRVVAEEIERCGGRALRSRVGHAFMKKVMRDNDAVFGGELSGHFYFRENFYCDSGMLALVHVLNVLSGSAAAMSERIEPLKRWCASGERNFENEDKDRTIERLAEVFANGRIDRLDGISVDYEDWWFNVRKSNTEPLLRLNLEARTERMLREKLAVVSQHLGRAVDH